MLLLAEVVILLFFLAIVPVIFVPAVFIASIVAVCAVTVFADFAIVVISAALEGSRWGGGLCSMQEGLWWSAVPTCIENQPVSPASSTNRPASLSFYYSYSYISHSLSYSPC